MYLHARHKEATEFVPFDWDDHFCQMKMFEITEEDKQHNDKIEKAAHLHFKQFNDAMYIRNTLCSWHAEKYVRPIWQDITVPFNEQGIWEATLLFIAPRLMSGYWQGYITRRSRTIAHTPTPPDSYLVKCSSFHPANH